MAPYTNFEHASEFKILPFTSPVRSKIVSLPFTSPIRSKIVNCLLHKLSCHFQLVQKIMNGPLYKLLTHSKICDTPFYIANTFHKLVSGHLYTLLCRSEFVNVLIHSNTVQNFEWHIIRSQPTSLFVNDPLYNSSSVQNS